MGDFTMPAPKKARKKTAEEGKLEINDLATTTDPKGGSGLADALTSTRKPPGAPDDPFPDVQLRGDQGSRAQAEVRGGPEMKAKKAAAKNAGKGRKLEIKDLGGAGEAKGGAGVQGQHCRQPVAG